MSKNTSQQDQLEMGNRRSRSPAHEDATQAVAPKPAAGLNNDDNSSCSSSQTRSYEPFVADQLNVERRVVLQLRQGFGGCSLSKMHAAFEIFNVAATVASFSPLPHFELKDELLEAFRDYLFEGTPLSTDDRYALSRVTSIGDNFLGSFDDCDNDDLLLSRCESLDKIDLSPLSNVTSVGAWFLAHCYFLKTIDLSPLSNVTTVGEEFLYKCAHLKTIDLSPLSKVTAIGYCFLEECSSLKRIDLSPLSNLTTVGGGFLLACSGLETIDLSSLSKLTTVGDGFLVYCGGLKTIDLSPLSNLTRVGGRFLAGCSDTVQAQGKEFLSTWKDDESEEEEEEEEEDDVEDEEQRELDELLERNGR